MLRLLHDLPPEIDVPLDDVAAALQDRLGVPGLRGLVQAVSAVFLDPLVALGAAEIDPSSPDVPRAVRLQARARMVIGSALIAAGEDVPPSTRPGGS